MDTAERHPNGVSPASLGQLYELLTAEGVPIDFHLFDVQLCSSLDFDWLACVLEGQCGICRQEAQSYVDRGLIRRWQDKNGTEGFILYSPHQAAVLRDLERASRFTEPELKHIMRAWNGFLETCVLNVLPYDDMEIADFVHYRRRLAETIEDLGEKLLDPSKATWTTDANGRAVFHELVEKCRREAALLAGKDEADLTGPQLARVQKNLWLLRWSDECVRVSRSDDFEAPIRQGYSPEFMFDILSHGAGGPKFECINWKLTLDQFRETRVEGNAFPLRTPDFDITPEGIQLLRYLTPSEYAECYEKYRIQELQKLIAGTGSDLWRPAIPLGKAECAGCEAMFDRADPRKLYCTEKCRARAKQRRWRIQDPERARLAQARYWRSYAEGEQN